MGGGSQGPSLLMVSLLFLSGQSSGSQSVEKKPFRSHWAFVDTVIWVLAFCGTDTPNLPNAICVSLLGAPCCPGDPFHFDLLQGLWS